MKKILFFIVVLSMLLNLNSIQGEVTDIPVSLLVNNHFVTTDSEPYIIEDRVVVPVRFVAQALGIEDIYWISEDETVFLVSEGMVVKFVIGDKTAYFNNEPYTLDTAPVLVNNRTMIPIRFIAEVLNYNVDWDQETYSVMINNDEFIVETSADSEQNYSREDILWLSRIVHVEAYDLSFEGKLAVANVVYNRMKSSIFPDTIHNVIFDTDYTVQFPPAHRDGFTEITPSKEALKAAKLALNGVNNIDTCLYFNNAPFNSKRDDLYKVIEGEYFYY